MLSNLPHCANHVVKRPPLSLTTNPVASTMDDGALPPWTRHQTAPPAPPRSSSFSLSSTFSANAAAPGMDEEDICRVCRESTPAVALLHPWYPPARCQTY